MLSRKSKSSLFVCHQSRKPVARDCNIQVLRFILSLFVLFFHTFLYFNFLNPLLSTPVNVFAMISGYFLVSKNDYFRGLRFLPTLLFLWVINILLNVIFSLSFHFFTAVDWKAVLLTGNNWAWWYLSSITILYIISPLLNIVILKMKKYQLLSTTIIACLIFQLFSYFVYNSLWIAVLFYCYLMGSFIRLHLMNWVRAHRYQVYLWTFIIFILAFAINTIHLILWKSNVYLRFLNFNNGSAGTFIVATFLFLTFLTFNFPNYRFFHLLGEWSLFIFAYHVFFIINMINITGLSLTGGYRALFVLVPTLILAMILNLLFYWYQKYMNRLMNIIIQQHFVQKNIFWINCIILVFMSVFYALYFTI